VLPPENEEIIPTNPMVAALAMTGPPRRTKDWHRTIGMFADDPLIDAITEAGRRIREAERNSE